MRGVGAKSGGLFWVTLSTAIALLLLGGLGTWQLERMAWKEPLIQQIQARSKAEPIILDAAATLYGAGEDLEYTPVRARGRFLAAKEMYYYAPGDKGPGYHVYVPLVGPSGVVLMVNRGFITEAERVGRTPATAGSAAVGTGAGGGPGGGPGATSAPIDVIGLLRRPEAKALFSPDNDPGRNMWFWRDLKGMADQALGDNPEARKRCFRSSSKPLQRPRGPWLLRGRPRVV